MSGLTYPVDAVRKAMDVGVAHGKAEAAATIARLEETLRSADNAKANLMAALEFALDKIARLEAEVKRLRDALSVARYWVAATDHPTQEAFDLHKRICAALAEAPASA